MTDIFDLIRRGMPGNVQTQLPDTQMAGNIYAKKAQLLQQQAKPWVPYPQQVPLPITTKPYVDPVTAMWNMVEKQYPLTPWASEQLRNNTQVLMQAAPVGGSAFQELGPGRKPTIWMAPEDRYNANAAMHEGLHRLDWLQGPLGMWPQSMTPGFAYSAYGDPAFRPGMAAAAGSNFHYWMPQERYAVPAATWGPGMVQQMPPSMQRYYGRVFDFGR